MENFIRNFIGKGPDKGFRGILVVIILCLLLWTSIFTIEFVTGLFMPRMLTGAIAAISGVLIGTWVGRLTD
jgi:hypothetical protein